MEEYIYIYTDKRFALLEETCKGYKVDQFNSHFNIIKQLNDTLETTNKRTNLYKSYKESRDFLFKLIIWHIEELKEKHSKRQQFTLEEIKDAYNKLMSEVNRIDNL